MYKFTRVRCTNYFRNLFFNIEVILMAWTWYNLLSRPWALLIMHATTKYVIQHSFCTNTPVKLFSSSNDKPLNHVFTTAFTQLFGKSNIHYELNVWCSCRKRSDTVLKSTLRTFLIIAKSSQSIFCIFSVYVFVLMHDPFYLLWFSLYQFNFFGSLSFQFTNYNAFICIQIFLI